MSEWLDIPFLPGHQVHPSGCVRSHIPGRSAKFSYRDCRPLTLDEATGTVRHRCRDEDALVYDDAIEVINENDVSTLTPCTNARIFRYDEHAISKWHREWPMQRTMTTFISYFVHLAGDRTRNWFKVNWNGTVIVFHGPSVAAAIRSGFPLPDDRPKSAAVQLT